MASEERQRARLRSGDTPLSTDPINDFEMIIRQWEYVSDEQFYIYEIREIFEILALVGKIDKDSIQTLADNNKIPSEIDLIGFLDQVSKEEQDHFSSETLRILDDLGAIPALNENPWEYKFQTGKEQDQLLDMMTAGGRNLVKKEIWRGEEGFIQVSGDTRLPGIRVNVGFAREGFGRPSSLATGKPKIEYCSVTIVPEAYLKSFSPIKTT